MEDQKPYEIKVGQHGKGCECRHCQPVKSCSNCGMRINGECTLDRSETEDCLSSPRRVHWRLKIENEFLNERGHARTCRCDECQHRDCDNCSRPNSGQECTMSARDINTCLEGESRPFWRPKTLQKSCRTFGRRISPKDIDCPLDIDVQHECVRDFWSRWEPTRNYGSPSQETGAAEKSEAKRAYESALDLHGFTPRKTTGEQKPTESIKNGDLSQAFGLIRNILISSPEKATEYLKSRLFAGSKIEADLARELLFGDIEGKQRPNWRKRYQNNIYFSKSDNAEQKPEPGYDSDYRPGSTVSSQADRIKELVDAHWSYQEKLLSAGQDKDQMFTWDMVMEMRKWDYTSSAKHFYGHGYEDAKGGE